MRNRTVTIVVPASKETVFDFLADEANLPLWATEFCERLLKDGLHYKVVTSKGELFFKIESDARTGVIDMFAGPELDQMNLFPARVIALGNGRTALTFTFFKPPEMPDEEYENQYLSLLAEMDGLKRRFQNTDSSSSLSMSRAQTCECTHAVAT